MSFNSSPIIFMHGSWHGAWAWTNVMEHLYAAGRSAIALDMAGHGLLARRPRYFTHHPFDAVAMRSEVSPVAGVDLDEAGDLFVSQIKRIGRGNPVIGVAHSMGGVVLMRAAQQAPELFSHMVYLAAFMPASGVPAGLSATSPENEGARIGAPAADLETIGAWRVDLATEESRQDFRDTYYADVDRVVADAAMGMLSPDVPLRITLGTTTLTKDGWGSIPRTYVSSARDVVIRPALQKKFIDDADAAFPETKTAVVTLDSSHSPLLSMPGQVADVVNRIG